MLPMDNMIRVKPTILTLLCLYINELSNYIERLGGSRAFLPGVSILILLYANDVLLISYSQEV